VLCSRLAAEACRAGGAQLVAAGRVSNVRVIRPSSPGTGTQIVVTVMMSHESLLRHCQVCASHFATIVDDVLVVELYKLHKSRVRTIHTFRKCPSSRIFRMLRLRSLLLTSPYPYAYVHFSTIETSAYYLIELKHLERMIVNRLLGA
jgi:hypothetical protein